MDKYNIPKNEGIGLPKTIDLESETSSLVHEQLARLKFAELHIPMAGKRVLELGCGSGYNCYYISEKFSPQCVVGLDISQSCIDYCKERYSTPITQYHVQDILAHMPSLGLFDVVIASEVIEHVSDQKLFLKTLLKYLGPNGVVFISTPNKAILSLSKEKSFINKAHIKELFFDEFKQLVCGQFTACEFYSQCHKAIWHSAYINSLCASNLHHAFANEVFSNKLLAEIFSTIVRWLVFAPLFSLRSKNYPDIRKRKYSDFDFVNGYENHAVWFITICSKPIR